MRLSRLVPALAGLGAWATAGVAAAAPGDDWAPKSGIYQLNYRFGTVLLIVLAIGIAVGLLATALFRYRRNRLDTRTGEVRRHTAGHMIMHWVNGIGFLMATISGAIMLNWIPITMDMVTLYAIHYVGAAAILIGFVAVVVNALTKGTTTRHRLIPTGHQVKETFYEMLAYAGLVGDRGVLGFKSVQLPVGWRREIEKSTGYTGYGREGKYLAAEEVLSYPFWALIGLLIISTGVLKAARYAYPISNDVVRWITIIHDWTAVATVIMLFVHVGALVLVKTNWPLFRSMFTGNVKVDYVRENHGVWYEELKQEAQESAAPARTVVVTEPGVIRKGQ